MKEEQTIKEVEISLADLLFFCLEKWRIIVVFMLLFSFVAGGYKYLDTVAKNRVKQQKILESGTEGKETESGEASQEKAAKPGAYEVDGEAAASYRQAVVESECALQRQEAYLKQSVIMQFDPYRVSTGTLNYRLESKGDTEALLSAYEAYVTDGGLAMDLHQANPEVSVEDLRYLTSFTCHVDSSYIVGEDQSIQEIYPQKALFKLQIRMPEDVLCVSYLEQAQKCVKDYAERLQAEVAGHELTLLSSAQSEITDFTLRDQQNALQSTHVAAVKNLQALKGELDAILLAKNAGMPGEEEQKEETEEVEEADIVLEDPVSTAVRSTALGAVMGAFLACFIFLLYYIMSGRLQSIEGFDTIYEMPLLGFLYVPEKKGRFLGFVDNWIYRARCGVYAGIGFEEQTKMAFINVRAAMEKIRTGEEKKRILLAGTIGEAETAGLCDKLALEMQGTSFSPYQQMPFQLSVLGECENYDAVLFLERRGVSYSQLIVQERKLMAAGDIAVLGAVVLS